MNNVYLKLMQVCTLHRVDQDDRVMAQPIINLRSAINNYLRSVDADSATVELDDVVGMLKQLDHDPRLPKIMLFFCYLPMLIQIGSVTNVVFGDVLVVDLNNVKGNRYA